MAYYLQDTNGYEWLLGVNDAGTVLSLTKESLGTPPTVYLNDSQNGISYVLSTTDGLEITVTATTFSSSHPSQLVLTSPLGYLWAVQVTTVNGEPVLYIVPFVSGYALEETGVMFITVRN